MHDQVVEGQVLAGNYRVERVLGVGGVGMVVAARHLQLDERVGPDARRAVVALDGHGDE